MVLFFIGMLISPIVVSKTIDHKDYFFDNVNVLVIGRCRSIASSDGIWAGGLYKGSMQAVEAQTDRTPLERLRVIVYNETITDPWMTFSGLKQASVGGHDVNGLFFWSAKGFGVSKIPPIVFIRCHAERFEVYYNETQYDFMYKDNSNWWL